jgi:hypothetical protein
MTAEAARIADQLANARTGRQIDLPGVIGLLGVPGFIYVNELLVSAESLAGHLTGIIRRALSWSRAECPASFTHWPRWDGPFAGTWR